MSILFDETEINGMSVRNRFVRSATWEGMCPDEGRCTKELVELTVDLAICTKRFRYRFLHGIFLFS